MNVPVWGQQLLQLVLGLLTSALAMWLGHKVPGLDPQTADQIATAILGATIGKVFLPRPGDQPAPPPLTGERK